MLSREIKFKLRFVSPVKLCFKPIGSEVKVCFGYLNFVART